MVEWILVAHIWSGQQQWPIQISSIKTELECERIARQIKDKVEADKSYLKAAMGAAPWFAHYCVSKTQ